MSLRSWWNARKFSASIIFIVNIIGRLKKIKHVVSYEQISKCLEVAMFEIFD